MQLITKVQIESFRSIRRAELKNLSAFTCLAGPNNSGKSNVLRALNAFFNDETDPGQPLDVNADYHRPDLRKKKKKRIRVAVCFDLPSNFRFRKGLEGVSKLLGGRSFCIAKEWEPGQAQASFRLNNEQVDADGAQKIQQFLSLIKFRYIPARVQPCSVIRSEGQNLRDAIVRRLRRSATQTDDALFSGIREIANRFTASLKARFSKVCPRQGDVALATPASWRDLAFAFGYQLNQGDVEIEDTAQGGGVQSVLMLETLLLVDRDYFQKFGWRQAAIWALEEPESSLHTSLEARVAFYLKEVTADPSGRLQVLCTTHSDLIVQYADRTILAFLDKRESTFTDAMAPKEAIAEVSKLGVSRWVHPILHFPLDPVILVEGETDARFLEEAFKVIVPTRHVHVADVSRLEGSAGRGGVGRLLQFLKGSTDVIARREAPVIVLLDWDAEKKKATFEGLAPKSGKANYKVFVWPEAALNPNLGTSFRGIERAYSNRIIDDGIKRGAKIGRTGDNQYIVQSDDYGTIKKVLAEIIRRGLTRDDLRHCEDFLREILTAAGAGVGYHDEGMPAAVGG